MERYEIYIPTEGTRHDVCRGSAIVGVEHDGLIHTHIEGGGASNVRTFEERLNQAAGRRASGYPTSAIRSWASGDVVNVGTARYDPAMRHWVVGRLVDLAALTDWLDGEEPPAEGGTDALRRERAGSRFMDLPTADRLRIAAASLTQDAMVAEILSRLRANGASPETC